MNGRTADIEGPELNHPDLGSWIGAAEPIVAEDVEDSPRDRALVSNDYGVTDYEQTHHEPLTDRLRREVLDMPATHRPIDPEELAARAPGRIVAESDGASIAFGDDGGLAAEETAMHLQDDTSLPLESDGERVARIEAEIHGLVLASQRIADALSSLAIALEHLPTDRPDQLAEDIRRAAHQAHILLLAAPIYADGE